VGIPAGSQEWIDALATGETRACTIKVRTEGLVHFFGKLVGAENSAPIAGARVTLIQVRSTYLDATDGPRRPGLRDVPLGEVESSADGLFELRLPLRTGIDVRVDAPGRSPSQVAMGPDHDRRETAEIIRLSRSAAIRAKASTPGGEPVELSEVQLWAETRTMLLPEQGFPLVSPSSVTRRWLLELDPDGWWKSSNLPAGIPLHVRLNANGATPRDDLEPFTLEPGETKLLVWRIGGCALKGTVVDQFGKPVQEQPIWLRRAGTDAQGAFYEQMTNPAIATMVTDSEGGFEFEDVSPGSWRVGLDRGYEKPEPGDKNAVVLVCVRTEIDGSTKTREVTIVAPRGLFITGQLRDASANPVPDFQLNALRLGDATADLCGAGAVFFRSGTDGSFAIGPLVPGKYELVPWSGKLLGANLQAEAGQSGLVLQVQLPRVLRGRVLNAATGLPCTAEVQYWLKDEGGWTGEETQSNSSGEFEVSDFGDYLLLARDEAGGFDERSGIRIEAGSEPVEVSLSLRQGARLELRNESDDARVFFHVFRDERLLVVDSLGAGEHRLVTVPTGAITLETNTGQSPASRVELALAAGETRSISIGDK
jgi:hypothetical protein